MPCLFRKPHCPQRHTQGAPSKLPLGFVMLLFGIEGFLIQTVTSVNNYTNSLYATYLGATQAQLGVIASVPSLVSLLLLLPAGLVAERMRSSRTMPVCLSFFMSAMYLLYAFVPQKSVHPIPWYFLFLGLTTGLVFTYNALWQTFFADTISREQRNDVYTFRTRIGYPSTMLVPLICGAMVSSLSTTADKILRFQCIYIVCSLLLLVQGIVLLKIPLASHNSIDRGHTPTWEIPSALREMLRSKEFMSFFIAILLFYASWYLDYGCWYLAQTRYGGMKELHLSWFSALYSLSQFLTLGIFARMNHRHSVHFTILLGIAGLALCPLAVILSVHIQSSLRPWVFMLLGVLFNTTPACIPLCVVQMLLAVIPPNHRSINISLYTMATCALQMIMPYLGSHMYQAWGANQEAMVSFYAFVMIVRMAILILFVFRYRRASGKPHWQKKCSSDFPHCSPHNGQ